MQTEKQGILYCDCTETLANTVHNDHIRTQYTGASDLKRTLKFHLHWFESEDIDMELLSTKLSIDHPLLTSSRGVTLTTEKINKK